MLSVTPRTVWRTCICWPGGSAATKDQSPVVSRAGTPFRWRGVNCSPATAPSAASTVSGPPCRASVRSSTRCAHSTACRSRSAVIGPALSSPAIDTLLSAIGTTTSLFAPRLWVSCAPGIDFSRVSVYSRVPLPTAEWRLRPTPVPNVRHGDWHAGQTRHCCVRRDAQIGTPSTSRTSRSSGTAAPGPLPRSDAADRAGAAATSSRCCSRTRPRHRPVPRRPTP